MISFFCTISIFLTSSFLCSMDDQLNQALVDLKNTVTQLPKEKRDRIARIKRLNEKGRLSFDQTQKKCIVDRILLAHRVQQLPLPLRQSIASYLTYYTLCKQSTNEHVIEKKDVQEAFNNQKAKINYLMYHLCACWNGVFDVTKFSPKYVNLLYGKDGDLKAFEGELIARLDPENNCLLYKSREYVPGQNYFEKIWFSSMAHYYFRFIKSKFDNTEGKDQLKPNEYRLILNGTPEFDFQYELFKPDVRAVGDLEDYSSFYKAKYNLQKNIVFEKNLVPIIFNNKEFEENLALVQIEKDSTCNVN